MAASFEFLFIVVLMLISTVLRNRKKNDKNSTTSAGRTASNAYDPSAPPGSKRNPLGRSPAAGTPVTAARSTPAAASRSRRTGKSLSFAEMRGDIPGFGRRASGTSLADDGHRLSGREDISCRQFGHSHPELDDMPRYIPHNDPENGYIVLNGKMMLLSEADKYENTI